MLIVNQNRSYIVNLNSVEFISTNQKGNIEFYSKNCDCVYHIVGNYETEQKAKDVLQKIWSAYANGEKVFLMP